MQKFFSSKERSTRLDRGDKRLMWALTLIYMVFTLLNLGTLSFPTSVWTAQSGAAVRIDLGAEYDVAEIWTNGNIAEGSAVFTGDDGSTAEYTQKYTTMFTWRTQTAAMHTRYITLQCTAGKVSQRDRLLRCRRQPPPGCDRRRNNGGRGASRRAGHGTGHAELYEWHVF